MDKFTNDLMLTFGRNGQWLCEVRTAAAFDVEIVLRSVVVYTDDNPLTQWQGTVLSNDEPIFSTNLYGSILDAYMEASDFAFDWGTRS